MGNVTHVAETLDIGMWPKSADLIRVRSEIGRLFHPTSATFLDRCSEVRSGQHSRERRRRRRRRRAGGVVIGIRWKWAKRETSLHRRRRGGGRVRYLTGEK